MQDVRAIRERLAAMLALSDENLLDVAVVVSREAVAISQLGAGAVTSRDIGTSGGSSKRCVDSPHILDVGGTSHTGDDGSFEIRLSDFFCKPPAWYYIGFCQPINFVATPQARIPVYLTTRQRIVSDAEGPGSDVLVSVWSWDSSGSAAPRTSFDWRCFSAVGRGER
jgi:hypothetical protein